MVEPSLFRHSANIAKTPYCEVVLTEEKLQAFIYAVKNYYWYQMYIDDLPIWGESSRDHLMAASCLTAPSLQASSVNSTSPTTATTCGLTRSWTSASTVAELST